MRIELTPLLQVERDLYDLPRGRERFERYIEVMTNGTSDMVAPLALLNPMGKDHVAACLDDLIAIGAERIAEAAIVQARRRLADIDGELKVALVLADDVGGGWTHRCLTEVKQRFEDDTEPKRGWAVPLFWSSESPTPDQIRAEVLAAIYRTCWIKRHGVPRILREMLEQEGLAACFAGSQPAALSASELACARTVIGPYRDSPHLPVQFACLYGDDAAVSVGYPPLGLPARAGFALAFVEARRRNSAPETLLSAFETARA